MQMDVEARARQIVADMGGHWRGSYGMVCCPAHNDRNPSLQVTPGKKAVLFKCWAGCSQEAVWSALNSRKINRHTSGETVDRAPEPSRRKLALQLWDSAAPIAGTAAERYLRSRAIDPTGLKLSYSRESKLHRGLSKAKGDHDRRFLARQLCMRDTSLKRVRFVHARLPSSPPGTPPATGPIKRTPRSEHKCPGH